MKDYLISLFWPTVAGILVALLVLDRVVLDHALLPSGAQPVVSYRDVVSKATPSVVNIYTAKLVTQRRIPMPNDPLLRRYFGGQVPRQRVERSLGSGVIMTTDGHIITNEHVIADADAIQVALYDGRTAAATVVGADPETDLAVLRIDLPDLTPAEAADPDDIHVGDVVMAIGNPFGFNHSVTQGIISGLGRFGLLLPTYGEYIQTDASIHPGNSGGALVDTEGRLVGINTLIYAGNGTDDAATGINLATPVDVAMFIMEDIVNFGTVVRGWLGVSVELHLRRNDDGSARQALLVSGLAEQGPAARAGLRVGDVIGAINGVEALDGRTAMHQIAQLRPGEVVNLSIERSGQILAMQAIVGSRSSS